MATDITAIIVSSLVFVVALVYTMGIFQLIWSTKYQKAQARVTAVNCKRSPCVVTVSYTPNGKSEAINTEWINWKFYAADPFVGQDVDVWYMNAGTDTETLTGPPSLKIFGWCFIAFASAISIISCLVIISRVVRARALSKNKNSGQQTPPVYS